MKQVTEASPDFLFVFTANTLSQCPLPDGTYLVEHSQALTEVPVQVFPFHFSRPGSRRVLQPRLYRCIRIFCFTDVHPVFVLAQHEVLQLSFIHFLLMFGLDTYC